MSICYCEHVARRTAAKQMGQSEKIKPHTALNSIHRHTPEWQTLNVPIYYPRHGSIELNAVAVARQMVAATAGANRAGVKVRECEQAAIWIYIECAIIFSARAQTAFMVIKWTSFSEVHPSINSWRYVAVAIDGGWWCWSVGLLRTLRAANHQSIFISKLFRKPFAHCIYISFDCECDTRFRVHEPQI